MIDFFLNLYYDFYIKIEGHKNQMKKVIIIGAGPAGLTAGYELLKDKSKKLTLK